MKLVAYLVFALVALMASGCDQLGGRDNAVAVIDLDAIARAIGRDTVMAAEMDSVNRQLSEQLSEVLRTLQQELDDERSAHDEVTEEIERELEQKAAAANRRYRQTQELAQTRANEFQETLVDNFRAEVLPYAREAALSRGAKAVLTVATPMIWYDSAVDITAEVIEKMRSAGNSAENAAGSGARSSTGNRDRQDESGAPSTPPVTQPEGAGEEP